MMDARWVMSPHSLRHGAVQEAWIHGKLKFTHAIAAFCSLGKPSLSSLRFFNPPEDVHGVHPRLPSSKPHTKET
eukprot:1143110-Pelagomonas_calceolata.AAC.6